MLKKTTLSLLCFLLCGSFAAQATTTPIIVGTNAEFAPFSYMENKVIVGFDIDIAKEVALRLGKSIQFKDMPFDALIPELILGHIDFAASGITYTKERASRVLFTKPYLSEDPFVIFTTSKQVLTLDNLKGKNVVVIEGFTADLLMSSEKGINLIRLPIQADGFMAIKSGRADAFITAKSTVDAFFKTQDAALFHTTIIDGSGENCAIAIPKSKPQMLLEVQKALDDMESDGTLSNLKIKWKLQ